MQKRIINRSADWPGWLVLLGVVCLCCGRAMPARAQGSVAMDRAALVALYDATDGANWTSNTNWSTAATLSTWYGVTTDSDGRVTRLSLGGNGLTGTIPAKLGDLTNLEWLYLFDNNLTGSIPAALGNLTNLTRLQFTGNALTGSIPAELGNLTNLEWLYLFGNNLTGSIPAALGNLSNLTALTLHRNKLTGSIPAALGNLTNLTSLYLWGNELTGTIPTKLGDLSNLTELTFYQNKLTGSIPAALGNLTKLTELTLYQNRLTGSIPAALGNLTNLTTLYLWGNELTGTIPAELGDLSNLTQLYLSDNELTGTIPTDLGDLTSLTHLHLSGNELTGTIPTELGDLSNLTQLYLWGNELTGTIPTELGGMTGLQYLHLSNNKLTGTIPAELAGMTGLYLLYLHGNELTGTIPTELGGMTGLYWLSLSDNELTGTIPTQLGGMTNLRYLYLSENELSGAIPTELGNLTSLQRLYLWGNELTGSIPTELGGMTSLQQLSLSENGLTGAIPTELGDLANLTLLYLRDNELSGAIPAKLGDLTTLQELSLSRNKLTGTLPDKLADLSNLQKLYLNGNTDLTGPLPLGLMNLNDLTTVWIQDTGLCAPEDAAFRAWAAAIADFKGCGAPPPRRPRPPPAPPGNFPTADAGPDQLGVWEGALVTLDGSGSSDPDGDTLRYRWNQYSGEPVVLSSRDVANPTFTAPEGLTADAVLSFRLLVTDPGGYFDSDTVTVIVDPEAEPPPAIYYFPHLAVGAGWQTTITYINYSSEEVSCRTEFLSDDGTPLLVSFADRGTVPSRTDTLPPGGSIHQETNVELNAPLAPGWVRATCTGPVKASLLYRLRNSEGVPVAEAGVNAATVPASRFVTFAEQGEGKSGTAVAYANPSDTETVITFTARDADGEVLASDDLMLSPNGHGAQNMVDLFDLTSFSGSLEVTSTQPIVTLSLNNEADPVFSSLPPGELDAAAQGPQQMTTYYFPHLAVGEGWQTTITYINYSAQEVSCQTEFLSDHGGPLMVSFAGLGMDISRTDVLPPGGSVHQETNVELSAPLAPGWAQATCSEPVKASLLFRRYDSEGVPVAEAGVNAATVPATRFATFAEQGEGRFGTGVAYANPSDTAALVTFTAKDTAGETLASVVRTLLPAGHDAQNMEGLFDLTSFTGSLEVTSTAPIVSLSLNFEAAPVFSSLPPGEEE